jgi:hypothetical protein
VARGEGPEFKPQYHKKKKKKRKEKKRSLQLGGQPEQKDLEISPHLNQWLHNGMYLSSQAIREAQRGGSWSRLILKND